MQSSKLITLLKTLSEKECKQLEHYINCPLFNTDARPQRLWDIIKTAAPDFDSSVLDRETVFRQLFPQKTFNYKSLSAIMSHLKRLTEDFLVWKEFKEADKTKLRQQYLLASLRKRRLNSEFEKIIQKITKAPEQQKNSLHDYYHEYLTEEEILIYLAHNRNSKLKGSFRSVLAKMETFSTLTKLKYWCGILNRNTIYNTAQPSDEADLARFLGSISPKLKEHPAIQVYFTALLLIKNNQITDFECLKKLLNNQTILPKNEIFDLYQLLINFCIRQTRKGETTFFKKQLIELYQTLLEKKFLLENGYIHAHHAKNIVTLFVKLGEFEWIKQFIEEYRNKIHPDLRATAYHFHLAAWHFYQKHYDETLQQLALAEAHATAVRARLFYMLDIKVLRIKVFYENNRLENDNIKSFQEFIRINKVLEEKQKKAHNNFTRLLSKLQKNRFAKNEKQISKLKTEIDTIKPISDKDWLAKKILALC